MSTMKKRIPMFLLALAMMVAMALPTFAAAYRLKAQCYTCAGLFAFSNFCKERF